MRAIVNSAVNLRAGQITTCLAGVILIFALTSFRWIALFRAGSPIDIDESGYLTIALTDYYGLINGGMRGWLEAIVAPTYQAPLTTALASLVFAICGPYVFSAFVIPLLAACASIALSYKIARVIMPAKYALFSAALVASCPLIVNYSRTFHFAMPATAIFCSALYCLLRSDALSRLTWAALFGIFLGLLPLTRTMTVAFLPGLVLGGAFQAWFASSNHLRRLFNLAGALLLGAIVCYSWFYFNGKYVFDYLFDSGYGQAASSWGAAASFLDSAKILLLWLIADIHIPHILLLFLGIAATPNLIFAVCNRRADVRLATAVSSPIFLLAFCTVEGFFALASSQNKGSAFSAPLLPIAIILAVFVLSHVSSSLAYRRFVATLFLAICAIGFVPLIDARWPTAMPLPIDVPGFGQFMFSDGRGTIQLNEYYGGLGHLSSSQPLSRPESKAWAQLNSETARTLSAIDPDKAPVAFGFCHRLYNANTVRLELVLQHRDSNVSDLQQLPPVRKVSTDESSLFEWFTVGGSANACFLLTLAGSGGECFETREDFVEQAAKQALFKPKTSWQTPDKRLITLWQREDPKTSCPPRSNLQPILGVISTEQR